MNCVLIDTWWNVNQEKEWMKLTLKGVLIDTWWNVNERSYSDTSPCSAVLIDTWWNVNVSSLKKPLGNGSRFNRYMVECECLQVCNP